MTTIDFLVLACRRWYVVVAGGVLTIAAFLGLSHSSPVYMSRATVIVPVPASTSHIALQVVSPTDIATVAAIRVNQAANTLDASTSDATLVGSGVTQGVSIHVRNEGTQWAPLAPDPYIDIDAVDHSVEGVNRRLADAVDRVRVAVRDLQRSLRVEPGLRVRTTVSPAHPVVTPVPPSRSRLLAACLLLGGAGTTAGLLLLERVSVARRRRSALPPAGAAIARGEPVG